MHNELNEQGGLPQRCRGRGARIEPVKHLLTAPVAKPSREGEICLVNDLVGHSVRVWFDQARRLQSLRWAVQSGKQSLDAIAYRIQLWSSILRSRGFVGGFRKWWEMKEAKVEDAPVHLPVGVPNNENMYLIFEEFMAHFRAFEQWHLQERGRLLRAKYQSCTKHLFQDLRKPAKNTPEVFWEDFQFEILASDAESGQVQLESAPTHEGDFVWQIDDQKVTVSNFDGEICTVFPPVKAVPGSILVQRFFYATTEMLHAKLVDFWKPRWQRECSVSSEQWARIASFTKAYMPSLEVDWRRLGAEDYRAAAKRMKRTAARGPDGNAREDVLHMSETICSIFPT